MTAGPPLPSPRRPARDEVDGAGAPGEVKTSTGFHVHLDVFDGPFDLLLGLVSKHKLDLTEVALATVTEEFLAYTKQVGASLDLGETTEFLVVAATLLDLKIARLLPGDPVESEEDLALLEARDLLFARLLQYRAYRAAAETLSALWEVEGRRHVRESVLEPRFAALVPDVVLGVDPQRLAEMAAAALRPRPLPTVAVDHVHAPVVDVVAQAVLVRERLAREGAASFRQLTADCAAPLEVVARFLALLDLYRSGVVAFEQAAPLGDLTVRWCGSGQEGPGPGEPGLAEEPE